MRNKRVLCVCSCNELRSPTMAWVLSNPPFNYNTRSCGTDKFYTLIPLTSQLLEWAEEIVCAERSHADYITHRFSSIRTRHKIKCLDIPDEYEYRQQELVDLIVTKYNNTSV